MHLPSFIRSAYIIMGSTITGVILSLSVTL